MEYGDLVWVGCATVLWKNPSDSGHQVAMQIADEVFSGDQLIVVGEVRRTSNEIEVVSVRGARGWIATDVIVGTP